MYVSVLPYPDLQKMSANQNKSNALHTNPSQAKSRGIFNYYTQCYPYKMSKILIARFPRRSMAGATRSYSKTPDKAPPPGEVIMIDTSPTNKRNTPESSKSAQKKAKNHPVPISIQRDHTLLEL
jgi:hypothetical protein